MRDKGRKSGKILLAESAVSRSKGESGPSNDSDVTGRRRDKLDKWKRIEKGVKVSTR